MRNKAGCSHDVILIILHDWSFQTVRNWSSWGLHWKRDDSSLEAYPRKINSNTILVYVTVGYHDVNLYNNQDTPDTESKTCNKLSLALILLTTCINNQTRKLTGLSYMPLLLFFVSMVVINTARKFLTLTEHYRREKLNAIAINMSDSPILSKGHKNLLGRVRQ